MESLLIVIAIIVAVFLTARAVMQPYRPRFAVRKRVPTHGIVAKARGLGKKCAATERGSGLSVGTLSAMRREYKTLQRRSDGGKALTSAQIACLINQAAVIKAVDSAKSVMRKSYALGHVDKRPRVFLLCDMLVGDMRGYIDINILKAAVKAFSECAPLTYSELDGFADMLRLCLCGLILKILSDENAHAEVYDDGVRDGGEGKVDIGRLSDCDYLCGVLFAVTNSDKAAFDALMESNAINTELAEKTRRRRLALAYSTVMGAIRSLGVSYEINAKTIMELSATDKVLAQIDGYDGADTEVKIQYLRVCEREAKKCGMSELAYAHTVADTANTVKCKISDYLSVGKHEAKKPVYTAIAASIVIAIGIVICFTFSYRYAAVFPMLAIAVYALFRPMLIIPHIGFKRRKRNAENIAIADYSPYTKQAYFGGETDFKQNTVEGAAAVVADNRGNITVKSGGNTATLSLDVTADSERIMLAAFDGVFSPHKTTYRIAAESAEFAAELIAPVDGAVCSMRVTALNRTDEKLDIGIFAAAAVKAERESQHEFTLGKAARADKYAVALCSDNACSERETERGKAELSNRFVLDGYEKRSIVINTLFAENPELLERRAVAMCGDCGFASDEAAARDYCANTDGFVGAREYTPIHEPQKREAHLADDVELPTVAYDTVTDFGGFIGDGGLLPGLSSGVEIENVLCDGEYCLAAASDGNSARLFAQQNAITCDDGLTSAFVALGEGGIAWTPTLRPLGKGNLYVIHHIGYSEYFCGYNGFVCVLRRYIAQGRRGELFDLTVENKTDKQRAVDIMLSVRSDCVCDVAMESGRLIAYGRDGDALFGIQSSERILEYTEFAEGYFNRGVIDRAGGFRSGGVLRAPTVSTRVSVLPYGAKRVIFILREGDDMPLKLDDKSADAILTAEKSRYAACARFTARTSDRALNRAFTWVQYSLFNTVKMYELTDCDNAARDIVLYRAARYFDVGAVKRKILRLCQSQSEDGAAGYLSERDKQSVTQLSALPLIVAGYVDFTRDFGALGEHVSFFSERDNDVCGASVLEHCLRAVDIAVRAYADGAKSISDAMLIRYVVKRYVQYCAESARKKRFEAAVRYADYAINDGFDGSAFGEYAGAPIDDKISLLPQIMCALTGACNIETAKTALETAKNRLFDAVRGKMRMSSETDYCVEKAMMLLYCCALYKADCCADAFEVLRACYRRGAIVYDSVGAQALFYSLIAEYVFGIAYSGDRITVNPISDGCLPDIAFDIFTERGHARVCVDNGESRGAWRMRMNNVVYSTDAIDCNREGEFDITLFRNGVEDD